MMLIDGALTCQDDRYRHTVQRYRGIQRKGKENTNEDKDKWWMTQENYVCYVVLNIVINHCHQWTDEHSKPSLHQKQNIKLKRF